ncbi:glycoside hydrolase family 3 protein [Amniculicola lignicola CBS 123094]|uniref:beta-glucosidase n=1 Tax=Amniculicola lignicola CBS 123094 TaxID=1392246 RepID=A0A6A5X1K6_9PLEO|nr:glycoside hydrolase family 3 protein [Amniculicola lignicola CBS 123094]
MAPNFSAETNIDGVLSQLDLDDKVLLLSGKTGSTVNGIERLGIPELTVADGPHGVRGARSFEPYHSFLLPCATSMGATFDVELLEKAGALLGTDAKNKRINVLLAPTVCLQRSPLIGRGFEAFGEDPMLSGLMGAAYIRGVQGQRVATCIKHYAAHDQSKDSTEDNMCMTHRTLRELHALPFQLAIKYSDPWSIMSAYHKINGVHASEHPVLLQEILRDDWGFKGLVMSDWWGTYSTSEAINAGLDLEMPGPSVFRGRALSWAVSSRKVYEATVDKSVRRFLELFQKTLPNVDPSVDPSAANTDENRALIRRLAGEGIVLLKNTKDVLPLKQEGKKTFGLIGDHFKRPALGGGGSSEVEPYYIVTPYDAMVEAVGEDNVTYKPGAYSFRYSPFLQGLTIPSSTKPGWQIELFAEDPQGCPDTKPLFQTTTAKDLIDVPESISEEMPSTFYVRARTTFTPETSCSFRFGLGVAGKGKLFIDGKECIDLWTSHPPKTDETPIFNRLSMEKFFDVDVTARKPLHLQLVLNNNRLGRAVGTAATVTARLGGFPVLDAEQAIADAVELASKVDFPIVMTGLSIDYEYEGSDRTTLALPGHLNKLIEAVIGANPKAIIVTQSGLPIEMPWLENASTLLHAWFGGQEAGHGLTDVLFGHINPAAKLPITFPKTVKDTPSYLTFGKVDRDILYGEGVFIGHRYYEKLGRAPLFYFGHGLSYTTFEYSNLRVPAEFKSSADYGMEISVDVTNTGSRDGSEVAQVYIKALDSPVQRPIRELKAFKKVNLLVGETVSVALKLDKYALSFWSEEHLKWQAEKGRYVVVIARSANPEDTVLEQEFALPATFLWSGL